METTIKPSNTGQIMVQRDKQGRIMSGSVLNPAGKPKGTKHLSTLLFDKLSETSREGLISHEETIVQKVIEMAVKGNMRAIELIWDRLEGVKPTQIITQISQTDMLTDEQKATLDRLINKAR